MFQLRQELGKSTSNGEVIEQVIRPTGLLDPIIEIRPATGQVDDGLEEIREHIGKGGNVLVTTLTKRLAEELTNYLDGSRCQSQIFTFGY